MERQFDTGSKRDSRDGKGRYDLIEPLFIRRLAERCEYGANKYGDNNWKLGQPLEVYVDSCLRHINAWRQVGNYIEDHLAAAAWNLMALVWTENEQKIKEIYDVDSTGDNTTENLSRWYTDTVERLRQDVEEQNNKEGEKATGNLDAKAGDDICGDREKDGGDSTGSL